MAYTERFTDTFTEASDTALQSHTPDTGSSWSAQLGTGSGPRTVIASDDSVCHPFSGGALLLSGSQANISGTWADDQQAEATNWLGATVMGIGTRIQSDGASEADGYRGYHNSGSSVWSITRVDSNVETSLGTFTDGSPTDANVIILQSEGNSHKLFEDGTERISASDSTYPAGGKPGLFSVRSLASGGLDNFKARDQAAAAAADSVTPVLAKSLRHRRLMGYTGR